MRRTAKHNATVLSFADFSGGINVMTTGDLIAANEMQQCQNFWFLGNQRSLQPRGGISGMLGSAEAEILSVYYDNDSNTFLAFDVDGGVYHVSSDGRDLDKVGTLTGKQKPVCAKFKDVIWIASGGKLQFYDYTENALSTVLDGPTCDMVFQRFARLCVSMSGTDRITYSATGDGTDWTQDDNDLSKSQWVDVGYGDSGDIIAVAPLATDLMILKNNGMIYQLTGDAEVASWAIYRIATETDAVGRQAALPIGNDVIFISRGGLKTLSTTMDYGNIATAEVGQKFNLLVTQSQFDPQMVHLRRRKLLLVRPTEDRSYWLAYNYALGAATTLHFPLQVKDIVETQDRLILAAGAALYEILDTNMTDDGAAIDYAIRLKDTVSSEKIIVRSIDTDAQAEQAGTVKVNVDNIALDMPTNRRRKVRCNHTTPKMEISLSGSSPFLLKHVLVEVADL